MKALSKCNLKLFKNQLSRFFCLIIIVIVSLGFMAGVGELEPKISVGINNIYHNQNVSDFNLKSSSAYGFSTTDLEWINEKFGVDNVLESFSYEFKEQDKVKRVYFFDLESNVNKLEIIEGRMPLNDTEILVERATEKIEALNLNDKVTYMGQEYTVCGIVFNPLYIYKQEEVCFNPEYSGDYISSVYYFNTPAPFINEVYVSIADRTIFDNFSDGYSNYINLTKADIESNVIGASVLTLYENIGLYSLSSYASKVSLISIIFVVFFLLITLLVVYSTMSRLYDEERNQIACMKTLGFSNLKIIGRYVLFVLLSTAIGAMIAFGVSYGLSYILYSAFNIQYRMPAIPATNNYFYFLICFAIILISNALLTLISGLKLARNKPTTLLAPKTAKAGKRVLLEKFAPLWNRLSFRYKSTLRNVFLFKARFLMTVVSVIGSTVLVFAGLGLLDCILKRDNASSLITISLALLIFSAVLCALIVYNLTNINVGERKREISTLMVLGYNDKEVLGYIYREIYIMGAIGAVLGIACGYFFMHFVFGLINFGSVEEINWWSYIITPVITMLFCFISTRLLKKKIIKTDMNASLKSIE